MIAVDTSALMTIVFDEPESDACITALEGANDLLIASEPRPRRSSSRPGGMSERTWIV
jgi:hypothetical protein